MKAKRDEKYIKKQNHMSQWREKYGIMWLNLIEKSTVENVLLNHSLEMWHWYFDLRAGLDLLFNTVNTVDLDNDSMAQFPHLLSRNNNISSHNSTHRHYLCCAWQISAWHGRQGEHQVIKHGLISSSGSSFSHLGFPPSSLFPLPLFSLWGRSCTQRFIPDKIV